jgi:BCCT, betaine/carnitine/choline family transporter
MLLVGGEDALTGLQTLTILAALPFVLVMIGLSVALVNDLRQDPMMVRRRYAAEAVDTAVITGSPSTAMTSSFPSRRTRPSTDPNYSGAKQNSQPITFHGPPTVAGFQHHHRHFPVAGLDAEFRPTRSQVG